MGIKIEFQQFEERIPIVRLDTQLRSYVVGLRERRGLTQRALAQKLGVSQQSYAQFEKEPWKASVERLGRVLTALDAWIAIVPREAEKVDNEGSEW